MEKEPRNDIRWMQLLFAAMFGVIVLRLVYLQILLGPKIREEAFKSRIRTVPLLPARGNLFDRHGTPLVRNVSAYDITLDPNTWQVRTNATPNDTPQSRQDRAVAGLKACLPGMDVQGIFRQNPSTLVPLHEGKSQRYRTITIARQVTADVGDRVKAMNLPGVGTPGTSRRTAVDGNLAAHVVGFIGREGNGLEGLEHSMNSELKGEAGTITAEFDRRGHAIPGTIVSRLPARQGKGIVLTIDSGIQNAVQSSLSAACEMSHAESGTAVVLDPKTGDILALANCPTYNVNDRGRTSNTVRMNRAVTAPYEPGSTLKVITAAAALEEKKVSPSSMFYCSGRLLIGRHSIGCAHGDKHGEESLSDVIKNSCNTATAEIGFKLGKETLHHYEKLFGFGDRTGSGLPGESRGTLSSPETWSYIQLASIARGMSISVTSLQIAAAYAAIANNGVYHRPRIVRGTTKDEKATIVTINLSTKDATLYPRERRTR